MATTAHGARRTHHLDPNGLSPIVSTSAHSPEPMKLAIISDVHANLAALEAVWADMDRVCVDDVLCLGDTLGYGNHTYNIAITFLNRRTGYYFKAAAIMAALDGLPESTPEHFEAVYEMLGKPWSRSIAEYLENCSSPSQIAESERKYKLLK